MISDSGFERSFEACTVPEDTKSELQEPFEREITVLGNLDTYCDESNSGSLSLERWITVFGYCDCDELRTLRGYLKDMGPWNIAVHWL